jgi:ribosome biogenesis GTPase / thiamine phosphate phosphatase
VESTETAVLEELGWNEDFAKALATIGDPAIAPARVSADFGVRFLVESVTGPVTALLSGPLRQAGRPVAVGDWIGLRGQAGPGQICHVLPRRSAIRRNAPDTEADEQVLAANIDLVFLASAVGSDFNLRRIERLLTVAYQSGAAPVVLLTKSDLDEVRPYENRLAEIAPGVRVVAVSGLRGEGIDAVRSQLTRGKTAVLIGSSGVGKSTLINRLLGADVLRTSEVHRGGQGRHTTSHRQLIRLPGGGLIIDTPGLREIQMWAGADALSEAFADIEELAGRCRFNDCQHRQEPGCAILAAEANGSLDSSRLTNYRKLQRELHAIQMRADVRLRLEERRKWKIIDRAVRRGTG